MSITAEVTIRCVVGCVKVAAVLDKMRRAEREKFRKSKVQGGRRKRNFNKKKRLASGMEGTCTYIHGRRRHWVDRGESEVLVLDYVDGGPPVGFLVGGG